MFEQRPIGVLATHCIGAVSTQDPFVQGKLPVQFRTAGVRYRPRPNDRKKKYRVTLCWVKFQSLQGSYTADIKDYFATE